MRSIILATKRPRLAKPIRMAFADTANLDEVAEWSELTKLLRDQRYDLAFLDVELLGFGGPAKKNGPKKEVEALLKIAPSLQIISMAEVERTRDAVQAVKCGARDYLTYPLVPEEIELVTDNVDETFRLESELDHLRDEFWQPEFQDEIRSDSKAMHEVFKRVQSVAPTRSTILLSGETGTGKGVLAKLIHMHSNRRNQQFIAIHCGAIPDTLLESELFGHERGAFTGANRRKLGKFEIADGGTIFLDEIGTITPSAQIKLLQVLQDRTYHRLGGEEALEADVRIIAATNVNLKELCKQGLFRTDLYYRLSVFPLEIPPLRERLEDIPHLSNLFLNRLNRLHMKEVAGIHAGVLEAFRSYEWPGNIRELENLIERAYVLEESGVLSQECFPAELFDIEPVPPALANVNPRQTISEVRKMWVEEGERRYLEQVLSECRGRIKETAERAGITTRQLHKLMKKLCLEKADFKLK